MDTDVSTVVRSTFVGNTESTESLLTPIVAAASSVIIVITVVLLVVAAKVTNIRRLVEFR